MLIRRFVELLTPMQCLSCGADAAVLCTTCLADFGSGKAQVCYRCGVTSVTGRTCERCLPNTALTGVVVGAHYGKAIKELILQLKFHRLRAAAEVAAELVLAALPEDVMVDVVTAVPVAPARYRERGYNQSELLARAVAAELRRPYAPLLGRTSSAHQLGQDRVVRLEQVRGTFYARRQLDGARVLVVDDVVTTGATLGECAKVLRVAGAGEVWGAAVARH
jgi:ComF family protein